MIESAFSGHPEMMEPESVRATDVPRAAVRPAADTPRSAAADARLRRMVDAHFDFVWRSLRRLGIGETDVDDCAQQVFLVASRKLDAIEAANERSFLFGTALRVASDARRARTRRREVREDDADEVHDPGPDPEQIADRRRARAILDEVLDAMPMDLRAPFVLFELEELSTAEIAAMLDLPTGTVASRLRRAREEFSAMVTRLRARGARGAGANASKQPPQALPGGER